MLYAILIHGSEEAIAGWDDVTEAALQQRHAEVRQALQAEGRLGPALRLASGQASVWRGDDDFVLDGPYAETKEQLLGLYVVDCDSVAAARAVAQGLAFEGGVFEIVPISLFLPGQLARPVPSGGE
ncbi:YciI family protein [Chitiniphilus shinanonensis]|uniref:YciI family protein n=1 Tax=Chitiniphilus shinanonensis TaxID=553088 RepID=UPI00304BEAC1